MGLGQGIFYRDRLTDIHLQQMSEARSGGWKSGVFFELAEVGSPSKRKSCGGLGFT